MDKSRRERGLGVPLNDLEFSIFLPSSTQFKSALGELYEVIFFQIVFHYSVVNELSFVIP